MAVEIAHGRLPRKHHTTHSNTVASRDVFIFGTHQSTYTKHLHIWLNIRRTGQVARSDPVRVVSFLYAKGAPVHWSSRCMRFVELSDSELQSRYISQHCGTHRALTQGALIRLHSRRAGPAPRSELIAMHIPCGDVSLEAPEHFSVADERERLITLSQCIQSRLSDPLCNRTNELNENEFRRISNAAISVHHLASACLGRVDMHCL